MHPGPEPWVTRLTALGAGGQAQAAGHFCFPLGMERQPGRGTLGLHTREALTLRHSSLSRTQPSSTVPGPATWVCLYPSPLLGTYTLAGLRKWRQKGQPKHLSQPPCLCPFQVLAMLVKFTLPPPCHSSSPQVSRCPTVNGEDRPLQSTGTHSPVEPLRTSACRRAHLRMFQSTKYPQHLPCLTHLPQLSLHG